MLSRLLGAALRVDSWLNVLTGVGGTSSKAGAFTFTARAILPDVTLQALYEQDGFAAAIIDCVPDEALRQGFSVTTGDEAADAALASALERLGAGQRLNEAWCWGRLYGGGAVFVGADDGRDPREPLDLASVRSVRFLTVLERQDITSARWVTDPLLPNFGDVEVYRLQRTGGGGGNDTREVHASRLLRFYGARTTARRRAQIQGWGVSELQRVYDKLQQFNATFAAVGELLQDGSQGVFKVKDLFELMSEDRRGDLKTRMETLDMGKSVAKSILVDADTESYERVDTGALSGYPDTLDKFALLLAGAARIPVTILMGQAPAGLSATGDSDIRWFYDRVRTQQQSVLAPQVTRLARILCAAKDGPTNGVIPSTLTPVFPPLWQLTDAEKADLRAKQATTDVAYITAQVLTPEEVALSRFPKAGWSPDTIVDLDARRAAMEAGAQGEGNAEDLDHEEVSAILAKVAGREIPRDSGLSMLAGLGLTPERAESVMGETGRSFFTAPEPGHAAALADAQAQVAKLTRSRDGVRQILSRVLEKNKSGELVVGRLIARAPTDTEEGDVLEEGDTVPVVEDSRFEVRRVDGRSDGFAVVLQLPPAYASRLPTETPAEDLHITLAFLGMNDRGDPQSIDRAVAAVRLWALTVAPIEATLGGIGRFAAGPAGEPVYVPVDSPSITNTRPALVAFLRAAGFEVAKGHGFTPHLTLAYVQPGDATPAPVPPFAVTCPTVSVWWDSVRVDIELTGGAA